MEPLSIDEAFLDLTGTERLHKKSPAETLAGFIRDMEADIGISASVGLAPNKFLAKLASDLEKPRGFSVIGAAEAEDVLAAMPVGRIWGVGKVFQQKLERDGIRTIGQLQEMEATDLARRYGTIGLRLARLSHGDDSVKSLLNGVQKAFLRKPPSSPTSRVSIPCAPYSETWPRKCLRGSRRRNSQGAE